MASLEKKVVLITGASSGRIFVSVLLYNIKIVKHYGLSTHGSPNLAFSKNVLTYCKCNLVNYEIPKSFP